MNRSFNPPPWKLDGGARMKTRHDRYKPFIDEIMAASSHRHASEVITDAVHCMVQAMWQALCFGENRTKAAKDYADTRARFDEAEWEHVVKAFCHLCDALTVKREEFLGHVMEELGATNQHNGQFFTPVDMSSLMGDIMAEEPRDEVIRLHDPCCGAGVLLIQGAEALLDKGWKQRNLCIVATDIDHRACDMCYVQLSLLGYAAVVQQVDALALKPFDTARYTPGWFLHGFPMRGIRA